MKSLAIPMFLTTHYPRALSPTSAQDHHHHRHRRSRKPAPLVISNIQVLQGALEVAAVHKDFRRRQGSLLNCYAITLREAPQGQGKVGIQLTFNERGRVTEALILENTVGDYLSECLLKKLKRFRFPDKPNPKGQVKAQLVFSLQ
jgi:hypothetical protein